MEQQHPKRHTIPQLNVPDVLMSAGGIDITVRQLLFIITGALLSVNAWVFLNGVPTVLRWVLTSIPFLIFLVIGWTRIQGQPLELWTIKVARYYSRPQIYIWRRFTPMVAAADPETEIPSSSRPAKSQNKKPAAHTRTTARARAAKSKSKRGKQ